MTADCCRNDLIGNIEKIAKKAESRGEHYLASTLYVVSALTASKEDELLNDNIMAIAEQVKRPKIMQ